MIKLTTAEIIRLQCAIATEIQAVKQEMETNDNHFLNEELTSLKKILELIRKGTGVTIEDNNQNDIRIAYFRN